MPIETIVMRANRVEVEVPISQKMVVEIRVRRVGGEGLKEGEI
jgi:hypothetical protein